MQELKGTEVILSFLGTGSSIPPIRRQQVSFALTHPKGTILFDAGEGTQYQLRKNKISTSKDFIICISHRHSDHTLGIPGLLSSFQLQGRTELVKILGPIGTEAYIRDIMRAFYVSVSYPLEFIELEPKEAYITKHYELLAVDAIHDAPGGALSYIWKENDGPNKFDTDKLDKLGIPRGPDLGKLQRGQSIEHNGKTIQPEDVMYKGRRGRVVAYSGDSYPNPSFIDKMPKMVDVLVHEASFPSDMKELALERGHSTISQAAQLATRGNIEQLILTHISPRFTYKMLKTEEKEIKSIFKNSVVAQSGYKYIIFLPQIDNQMNLVQ